MQSCTICDPLMLAGSGLSINSYSEEEARTRQLVIALGRHVVGGEYFKMYITEGLYTIHGKYLVGVNFWQTIQIQAIGKEKFGE